MTIVNRTVVASFLANGEPLSRANNRGVGNTTAAILSALAAAIKNPGEAVAVKDTALPVGTRHHANHTCRMTHDIIHRLGLEKVTVEVRRIPVNRIGGYGEHWLVLITSTFAERV